MKVKFKFRAMRKIRPFRPHKAPDFKDTGPIDTVVFRESRSLALLIITTTEAAAHSSYARRFAATRLNSSRAAPAFLALERIALRRSSASRTRIPKPHAIARPIRLQGMQAPLSHARRPAYARAYPNQGVLIK
jgi:hypothetical protein